MSSSGSVADTVVDPVKAAAIAGYISASGTLTPTRVVVIVLSGAAIAGALGFGICYYLSTRGYFPAPPPAPEKKDTEIPVTKLD